MHSISMASNNLNHSSSIRSSNSSTPSSKEQQDYLPDSLKNVFAEARKQIEKATSMKDDKEDGKDNEKKKFDTSIVFTDEQYSGLSLDTSLLSPESDIVGPFDTAMGSVCRRNPADLYKTTAEAKEQALDDKPGVCPDHEDDCQCHLNSVFPVFNLEAALQKECSPIGANGSRLNPVNERQESGNEGPSAGDDQDDGSCANIQDFLPRDNGDAAAAAFLDRNFSQDTDLSFQDDDDDDDVDGGGGNVGSLEYHPNDDSSSSIEKEEDIFEFLPNNNNVQQRVTLRNENKNTSNSASPPTTSSTKNAEVKHTSPRLGFLGRNKVQKKQENHETNKLGKHRKPKNRVFNVSIPRSPRIKSRLRRKSLQYESLDDPMQRISGRMDVPLTIELRTDKPCSKLNTSTPPRNEKRKRLTIPKTPRLLTKQKRGDRRYSTATVGLDKENDACMKQSLLQGTKRTTSSTIEANGYKSTGLVERPLTRPKSPTLALTKKFGERRYSTVGRLDVKDEDKEGIKEIVVNFTKPTVPKTPKLSFFQRKVRKNTNNEQNDDRVPVRKQELSSFHKSSNSKVFSSRPLTVPQPFHLATNDRAQSSRRSKKETLDGGDGSCSREGVGVAVDKSKEYVFRARPVPDFSRTLLVSAQSKLPVRPLTVPQPFHLATNDRAHSPRRSTKEPIDGGDGSCTREGVGVAIDKSKEYVFRARPVPDFSRTSLVSAQSKPPARPLTVPQPFHLATNDRAHSPRRSKKEPIDGGDGSCSREGVGVAVDKSKEYVFRARPVPDFSRTSLVSAQSKPPARPLTVPQPFHFATNDRAHSPRRSTKETLDGDDGSCTREGVGVAVDKSKEYVFRARPVPDFSRTLLVSAQSKPPARPLTVPQPFHLATNDRAHSPRRSKKEPIDGGDGSCTREGVGVAVDKSKEYVFRARPVPDFSRTPLLSSQSKLPVRPLTVPQPFHLATNDRAHSPRRSTKEPIDGDDGSCSREGVGVAVDKSKEYVFRARPVPDFSRTLLVSAQSKLPVRPLTVPQPFNLVTSQRPQIRHQRDTDTSYATEEKFVSCFKKISNFSRNPNGHRKALQKRTCVGKTPFRTLNNFHAEEPTSSSQVRPTSAAEAASDENTFLPHARSPLPIPDQQCQLKHEELRQKLNRRSKQNAVARAEQYDETLNMVNHFVEENTGLLSSSTSM